MQKPKPLGSKLLDKNVDAGHITAWAGKAGNQAKSDRVFAPAENDRDRGGRGFSRKRSRAAARRGDYPHVTADQLSRFLPTRIERPST
jgi:hypothetical protein